MFDLLHTPPIHFGKKCSTPIITFKLFNTMAIAKRLGIDPNMDLVTSLSSTNTSLKTTVEVMQLIKEKRGFIPQTDKLVGAICEMYIQDAKWHSREVTLKSGEKTLVFNATADTSAAVEQWLKGI